MYSSGSESDSEYSESSEGEDEKQRIVSHASASSLDLPQLAEYVKKWTILDHQLKIVYEKTKKMREYKSQLGKAIIEYMENHQKRKNKIHITNGELSLYEKKEYRPLTFAFIEKSLTEIIPDPTHVDFIIEYLKEKRSVKYTTEIRRKMYAPTASSDSAIDNRI